MTSMDATTNHGPLLAWAETATSAEVFAAQRRIEGEKDTNAWAKYLATELKVDEAVSHSVMEVWGDGKGRPNARAVQLCPSLDLNQLEPLRQGWEHFATPVEYAERKRVQREAKEEFARQEPERRRMAEEAVARQQQELDQRASRQKEIRERVQSGKLRSTAELAKDLGVPCRTVIARAKRAGIKPEVIETRGRYAHVEYYWHPEDHTRLSGPTRPKPKPKDYAAIFTKRYVSPDAALPDASEAMFSLNRYTRWETCSDTHKREILGLKTKFIECLYGLDRYTDRVKKLVKRLPRQVCFTCDGTGEDEGMCFACDGTGIFRPAREVASYVFTFTVGEQHYTWMQPGDVMSFEPKFEETRCDDGTPLPLETEITIPRSKLAEAKALVRWVIDGCRDKKVEDLDAIVAEELEQETETT